MMSLKYLVAGLSLCLTFRALFAATDTYEGTVRDDSGNSLEFANVALLSLNDSTLVSGAVTDAAGRFIVAGNGSPVFVRISAMGFEDNMINNPRPNLGDIILAPASYMLGEVVVKGSQPVAKIKGDGLQVAISGTYLANTGTALELLGKIPFVTRTGSEIEVLGKGSPLIYINGRQVRDISELDQLSSVQIKNVEVITNPGARYASTVNSVIKITTVASVGEGFSFNNRTTIGYKRYAYLFEQVNFNWRRKGFDLFCLLNYENYRERPAFSNTTFRYLKTGVVRQNSMGHDFAKYPVHQGKIGLNYSVSAHNLGFYYDYTFKPSAIRGTSQTHRYIDDIFQETIENRSAMKRHDRQHLFSAYYSGEIGQWQLSANFDALWQINDSHNAENEISTVNPARDFTTDNDVCNRLFAGNVMASFPVWKGDFRFGAEVSDILRTDRYCGDTDYIADSDIRIAETTAAVFAEAEQTFGRLAVSMGLRWEYTDSRYWQSCQFSDDQSRKYHNLAPSVSLSFPTGDVKVRVSYMRKTSRPAFEQLSSAVKYIDRYSFEKGNPNLKPVYRDYISASASWRDLVLELEYCYTKNYFMWQTKEYPGSNNATLLTMENMPGFNIYGAYVNYAPTFFGCWHPALMAGISVQNLGVIHSGSLIKLNRPLGIFRFDNAIRLPRDIWLDADFAARTSGNGDNYYMKSYWQCNIALYKSFANDTWSIRLQLNDVFDTWRQAATLYDALSRISTVKIYDTRDLSLTVKYNFNSSRTRYKGRGAGNTDKSRF